MVGFDEGVAGEVKVGCGDGESGIEVVDVGVGRGVIFGASLVIALMGSTITT